MGAAPRWLALRILTHRIANEWTPYCLVWMPAVPGQASAVCHRTERIGRPGCSLAYGRSALVGLQMDRQRHRWWRPKSHPMKSSIQFALNGWPVTLNTDDDRMLLWALRTDLELT